MIRQRTGLALLAAFTLSTAIEAGAPSTLVAHLPLDGDLLDVSGNDNHGTYIGEEAATFTEGFDGTPDGAVTFDGADDYVSLTHNADLPLTMQPAFTVLLRVKGPVQQDKRVFSEGTSQSNNLLFNLGTHNTAADGTLDSFLRNSGGTQVHAHRHSQQTAFDDSWHHIAWVDDNGTVSVYIDGLLDSTDFNYTRFEGVYENTTLGGILRATSCCHFQGAIDDVRLYNSALTEAEVQNIANDCPEEGDTHITDFVVTNDDGVGGITVAATANDDSGDEIIYSFVATGPEGQQVTAGPQLESETTLQLGGGDWLIVCTVDDDEGCPDSAEDGSAEVEVSLIPAESLIAKLSFDGDLIDSSGNGNDGAFIGDEGATFVEGFDGTPMGAVEFDGADDLVLLNQNLGLPISHFEAFTVAMWVKGPVQNDRRVFSEGTAASGTPLFNIGTHNQGANGALDYFLRYAEGTLVGHAKTGLTAFDDDWHHIAVVDAGGMAFFYVDGVLDGLRVNYTRPARIPLENTTIGAILRGTSCCWFQGAIDEVCLFNYALSPEEIAAMIPQDGCPAEGDTHCDSIGVAGPDDGIGGEYTFTAAAIDDSGDAELYYTFILETAEGTLQVGPQTTPSITRTLAPGDYVVRAVIDDDLPCQDSAGDQECVIELTVLSEPERRLAYYPFDGDTLDAEGTNDGVFQGGDPVYVAGFDCGPALSFDGADDLVVIPGSDDLPTSARVNFSVAMWVKGGAQNDRRVYSESNTQGNNTPLFNLGTQSAGATGQFDFFYRQNSGANTGHLLSAGEPFDDSWHHIAWVDDNGEAKFYLDGVLDTEFSYTRAELTIDTTTIGGILRGSTCCLFTGAIDDVQIFNFLLTDGEVADIYGEGAASSCCPEEGDTHCLSLNAQEIGVEGDNRIIRLTSDAIDDSGDPIIYSFRAIQGETVLTAGPQAEILAEFTIGPGEWTFEVLVDDDPGCPDEAGDARCSITESYCPLSGDTSCTGVTIDGPEDNLPGTYLVMATGSDASGDRFLFTFTADNGVDDPMVAGPQAFALASFELTEGDWTIRVSVDDDPDCDDASDDMACTEVVTVVPPGGGQIPGDCNQDGDLNMADGICILEVIFSGAPMPVECEGSDFESLSILDWQPDGEVDLSDAVSLFSYLFLGGPAHTLGLDCLRVQGCPEVCTP